jgi:hypothetical protein
MAVYMILVVVCMAVSVNRANKLYEHYGEFGTLEGADGLRGQAVIAFGVSQLLFQAMALSLSGCEASRGDKCRAIGINAVIALAFAGIVVLYQRTLMRSFFSADATFVTKFCIRTIGE